MQVATLWQSLIATMAMNVAYAMVFYSLERMWPARPGQVRLRAGFGVDLAYVGTFAVLAIGLDALPYTAFTGWLNTTGMGAAMDASRRFFAGLPGGMEALLAVVIADFTGYWKHRLHHTRLLWPVHAVHHSSMEVDWLSNERVHPVESVLTALIHLVPLLVLGVSPLAIAVAATVRRAHSLYEHANVRFTYGRLEHVLVSPTLHRWHHASDPTMFHKNFANVFSLFDWMFGTLRLPDRAGPTALGLPWMPAGFWAQLLAPLRRYPRS